jgi:hypothetical protein
VSGRYAGILALLAFLTAGVAQASLELKFTAFLPDGVEGTGSFKLDQPCVICANLTGLSNFILVLAGNTFHSNSLTYLGESHALSGAVKLGDGYVVFTPSGRLYYDGRSGGNAEAGRGNYRIDPATAAETSPNVAAAPEPLSSALVAVVLAVGLGAMVFRRRVALG